MRVQIYIQQRYKEVGEELLTKNLIAELPPLALTKARRFWGRIRKYKASGELIDIRISTLLFQRLYEQEGEEALRKKLDETICHELAHMTHWYHQEPHSTLTKHYLTNISPHQSLADIASTIVSAASANKITLADITTNPSRARAQLRKAGIEKPGSRWEWFEEVPKEVKDVLGL